MRPCLVSLLAIFAAAPLAAQCPDGAPPPCRGAAARVPANSIAVLYFDNLSRDTSYAYLADGLTEEIIASLGKVRRLNVKSLYASQQFRGRPVSSPGAIGRVLGAAYLLRGSVRPAAGRVRVTYELLAAANGTHVAGDVLERGGAEVAGVPGDIAAAVATAIVGPLLPAERTILARRPTDNAEAHDLYLRALHAADSWSQQGPQAALVYLDRAIALDSGFANAYAAKAVASAMLADGFELPREAYTRVREAAGAALRRDSTSALAWAMMAIGGMTRDYDMDRVAQLSRKAIALDPQVNWGHILLGTAWIVQRRTDEALAALRRGWAVDSLDAAGAVGLLWGFQFSGMTESLAVYLPRMHAALSAEDRQAYEGLLHYYRGDFSAAAGQLNWRYYGGFVAGELVHSLVATGRSEVARATVDSMTAARTPGYYNALALAKAYVALGDRDRAFEWLDRANQEQTFWLIWLRLDPLWAPLRSDPRFDALLARTKL
jgi:TolB-like protein